MVVLEVSWTAGCDGVGIVPERVILVESRRILLDADIAWPGLRELAMGHDDDALSPAELRTAVAQLIRPDDTLVCHRACPLLQILGLSEGMTHRTTWSAETKLVEGAVTPLWALIRVFAPHVIFQETRPISRAMALDALFMLNRGRTPAFLRELWMREQKQVETMEVPEETEPGLMELV
jgi:hypothetical protein